MTRAFPFLLGVALLTLSVPKASGQEDWDGKTVEKVVTEGFRVVREKTALDRIALRENKPYTVVQRDLDYKALYESQLFDDVQILPVPGATAKTIVVTLRVVEAPVLKDVAFTGLSAIPIASLRPFLRLNPGDRLNPHYLKGDRDSIHDQYITKGYHFSRVRDEITPGRDGGVVLTWHVSEGPLVSVREIILSGNDHFSSGRLKEIMQSKENHTFLFIPAGKEPFVRKYVEEDLTRIKIWYSLEGWLDIVNGDRVFIEDLIFSEDKSEVTVRIHVDEGRRYAIRGIQIRGNRVLAEEEIRGLLTLRPGDDYSDNQAGKDAQKIRERYGEIAYIQAEIEPRYAIDIARNELDLVFEIRENQEMRVGRITVQGNTKTRLDVILRELKDFTPGEKFNNRSLLRGITRLKDRGYFETPGGVIPRQEEGDEKDVRDVVLQVTEGQTGNLRFSGGYSSSFGILGLIEFTQRNFDIADLPTSLSDLPGSFVGGGQFFRARLAPSARRQSFTLDFKEPYLFGYEYGMGLRAYDIRTQREDWDEDRLGGSISFDKRIDLFRIEVTLNAFRIEVDDVDSSAPSTVRSLEGVNRIFSLTPGIVYDARDSSIFASEGFKISLTYEYAGQILPGDFDYFKAILDADIHFTLYETEEMKLKHVLSFYGTFGRANEKRGDPEVPFFERFYGGGHDSIRGFEFRGMGPHINGDPVGGEVLLYGSVEYSFPLFVEFLRGAMFYDIANLGANLTDFRNDVFRNTLGFGIRFIIPGLTNIPVALDFGFPFTKEGLDERQTVTFDIGKLF